MARNEEKQFGRLNRLYLEKEKQEYLKKHPTRPKLISLNSADKIKKWLPSIKTDIDFCLKQSQVACYPDAKIEEYSQKIESLSREYKAFLRKYKQLDPSVDVVPWTERAYSNKRSRWAEKTSQGGSDEQISKRTKETESRKLDNNEWTESNTEGSVACVTLNFNPIHTPVLDTDKEYENCYGYNEIQPEVVYNSNPDLMDRPLEFTKQTKILCEDGFQESCDESQEDGENVFQRDCSSEPREHNSVSLSDKSQKKDCGSLIACDKGSNPTQTHVNLVSCNGSLNLPYSDSSSDETEDQDCR